MAKIALDTWAPTPVHNEYSDTVTQLAELGPAHTATVTLDKGESVDDVMKEVRAAARSINRVVALRDSDETTVTFYVRGQRGSREAEPAEETAAA